MPRLCVALLLVLGLAACGQVQSPETEYVAGPLPEQSLYHLGDVWTTQHDAPLHLADLRGKPVVVALVYAHCAYACPLLVRDMKRIAGEMREGDTRYVLVSLDPERDTPAQLRSLQEGFGLGDDWTLLRGDPRSIRRLAALVGVQYRTEADGEISHSNIITVLDRDGLVVRQQEGLDADPTQTVAALRNLFAAR